MVDDTGGGDRANSIARDGDGRRPRSERRQRRDANSSHRPVDVRWLRTSCVYERHSATR